MSFDFFIDVVCRGATADCVTALLVSLPAACCSGILSLKRYRARFEVFEAGADGDYAAVPESYLAAASMQRWSTKYDAMYMPPSERTALLAHPVSPSAV
jgi:hypothetical protein